MKLQHIEMILAIEKAGSIRGAAKALGRTQPALTKALRQAEEEIGAAIFKRAPSGVVVTEHGRAILLRAKIIQGELRRMQEEVRQLQGKMTGTLRVTVSPLAAARFIPPAMRRFRRRFGQVRVQINGGHEPVAFGPLRQGDVDFVIGPAPQGKDAVGLTAAELVRTPISVITGQTSRYASARSLRDLSDADWIMIGPPERQPAIARYFAKLGQPVPVAMTSSDSIISILSMIQDSDLVCTFPSLLLDAFEDKWKIRRVPVEEEFEPIAIALTSSAERPLTPAGRFFHECVTVAADGLYRPAATGYAEKLSQ